MVVGIKVSRSRNTLNASVGRGVLHTSFGNLGANETGATKLRGISLNPEKDQ
jgi:hypothetical protein